MQTRVLVVDDDIEMTDLIKIILEPNTFEVFAANSGQDGVDLAHKLKPDVVLLDLLMRISSRNIIRRLISLFFQPGSLKVLV